MSKAVSAILREGVLSDRGDSEGWTDGDISAIEDHVNARVDGLIRRFGAAERRKRRRARVRP